MFSIHIHVYIISSLYTCTFRKWEKNPSLFWRKQAYM